MSKGKEKVVATDVVEDLGALCATSVESNAGFALGLANLKKIQSYSESNWLVAPYSEFSVGTIGFKSDWGSGVKLVVACGKAQQRSIMPRHFIAMVEGAGDEDKASVLIQNFSDVDEKRTSRGQIIGQLNFEHSALIIYQGLAGKVIKRFSDIALQDVYYIPREELAAYYVACKFQMANSKRLDEMSAANEGWKAFNIPLDLKRPYDARV